MTPTSGTQAESRRAAMVFVAVCCEVRERTQADEIGRLLAASAGDSVFAPVGDLCAEPEKILESLTKTTASRLVLGLCPGEFSVMSVQRLARRAGLDPFGVQTPDFRSWRQMFPAFSAVSGAATTLIAAAARARAFSGSLPEQSKAVLPGLSDSVSRRSMFRIPFVRYAPTPAVDHKACVAANGCRQCVKACPHSALSVAGGLVRVSRSDCRSCGLCVTACPQRAVDLPGYSAHEIEAQMTALAEATSSASIAFVCRNAPQSPGPGWQQVQVACAGMIPAAAMFSAIADGAKEVCVYQCTTNCINGASGRLAGTVDYCREVLRAAGESPDRVRLLPPADVNRVARPSDWPEHLGRGPGAESPGELFGAGAAGRALMRIARGTAAATATIEHLSSPLALPEVNPLACTACGTCSTVCPAGAIRQSGDAGSADITVDPARCIGCGECVAICPERERGAISVSVKTDVARIASGPHVQFRASGVQCRDCGAFFTTREVLARLKSILGDDFREEPLATLCPHCRGK